MVRHIRPSNSPEIDGIILLQRLHPIWRRIVSPLVVILATPIKMLELEIKGSNCLREAVEDLDGGFGNVDANAVTRNRGYAEVVRGHGEDDDLSVSR